MAQIMYKNKSYAASGPHSDEIKQVVKDSLIVNTFSNDTDKAASVALVSSLNDQLVNLPIVKEFAGNMPTTKTNILFTISDHDVVILGACAYSKSNSRWETLPISTGTGVYFASVDKRVRIYITTDDGLAAFGGSQFKIKFMDIN